jgi:SWI/SNF-related matrix-associated actin-dependent regulator of chromatin subfamily A-like protein 1
MPSALNSGRWQETAASRSGESASPSSEQFRQKASGSSPHDVQLDWDAGRLVLIGDRPMLRREARPTGHFWQVWKRDRSRIDALGLRLSRTADGFVVSQLVEPSVRDAERAAAAATHASQATSADIDVPTPPGMVLKPFQRAGVAWMLARPRSLLADEPGLGKTIQAIGLINALGAKRVLVVCPASLKANWRAELEAWLSPMLPITVIGAGDPVPDTGVVVVNYDLLDRPEMASALTQRWDVAILDEAHALKNPAAQRTKALFGDGIGKPPLDAGHVVALTGTPITNRPVELWPLLRFADQDRWTDFEAFARRYCAAFIDDAGELDTSGASNTRELQTILRSTVMMRRSKAVVLGDLPPKIYATVSIDAAADLVAIERDQAERSKGKRRHDGQLAKARHAVALAKVPHVVEFVRGLAGKALVFGHHGDVVSALAEALGADTLTGTTPATKVECAKARFQNNPDCRILVCSIRAAAVGHTLTAADHVVLAEFDWSPGQMSQAEDRAHRLGRIGPVAVHHVVLRGSLDEAMSRLLIRKAEILDRATNRTTARAGLALALEADADAADPACRLDPVEMLGLAAVFAARTEAPVEEAIAEIALACRLGAVEAREILRSLYRRRVIVGDADTVRLRQSNGEGRKSATRFGRVLDRDRAGNAASGTL